MNCCRLHHEIKHFFEAVSPTPSEISARESLLKRITDVVAKLWSAAKVRYVHVLNCIYKHSVTVCADGSHYRYALQVKSKYLLWTCSGTDLFSPIYFVIIYRCETMMLQD